MKTISIFALALTLAACAGNPPIDEPLPMEITEPVTWRGDEDLAPVLVRPTLTAEVMAAAERVEMRVGPTAFIDRLGAVVEDTTAHWLVRLNALRLLASRGAIGELPTFAIALDAADERVRIAAVSAMREFLAIRPEPAIAVLARGLEDPSPRVQTAALQVLAARDVELVRAYYERARDKNLRAIALDLIQVAEERGAPMVAIDTAGTLERTTATGAKLTFKPTTRWPNWDAAVGAVIVTLPGKKATVMASGVEVVANVVPAFFVAEGKTLVYELNREIHARDLDTGVDRKLADGIAPRILPFTNDVLYFSENTSRRLTTPNSINTKYQVMRVPVTGGTPASIGEISARALNNLKGNYSTLRWSRIEEQEGNFYLVGEMIDDFRLPSPFGAP
ncbi:MAG: hypothetical protein ACT4O1_02325 [Gemmatimonadota bacterium]